MLDEIAAVVDGIGQRALGDDAAPVVQCLVEEVVRVAKEAGLQACP